VTTAKREGEHEDSGPSNASNDDGESGPTGEVKESIEEEED